MNDNSEEMPTTGADNKIKLGALRGKDYDDEMWDSLLDELSIEDMTTLIAGGGYQTTAIDSIEVHLQQRLCLQIPGIRILLMKWVRA